MLFGHAMWNLAVLLVLSSKQRHNYILKDVIISVPVPNRAYYLPPVSGTITCQSTLRYAGLPGLIGLIRTLSVVNRPILPFPTSLH